MESSPQQTHSQDANTTKSRDAASAPSHHPNALQRRSVPTLTPGSEAFARQGSPRLTPETWFSHLLRRAAGLLIRNVSAPPDNHGTAGVAVRPRLQDSPDP